MKRNDPELDGLFHGAAGLWAAVLLSILEEIEAPAGKTENKSARRLILEPEIGCLPFIAAVMGLDIEELQRRIIRYLRKKRITI